MKITINLKGNFWETNPNFLALPEFKKFKEQDKSKGCNNSSLFMWGLTILEYPDGDFAQFPRKDREVIANDDYFSKCGYKLDAYSILYDEFKKVIGTRLQRVAMLWGDKLDERTELIMDTPYDMKNAEDLDKMMARTDKIWKQYLNCLKDLEAEKATELTKGGTEESLTEKGLI